VFTSPVGKVAFNRGYYGASNMPALFQQTLMEKVVLPTIREYEGQNISLHGWVDDVPGGADDPETMVNMLLAVVDRFLAIGARLNLKKCTLMGTELSYCGIAIDLAKHTWRVDPTRIDSITKIPVPTNREQLTHVLGIIRYYYFATHDLKAQRERVGLLAALDIPGIVLTHKWNYTHTKAMTDALTAIQEGKWALCFDPRKPVYITTDAAGSNGYCIANEEGQNTVEAVEEHKQTADGSYEFLIRWYKIPVPTWVQGHLLNKVRLVQQYCAANGLMAHHKAPAPAPTSGKARKPIKS
jgi:hypothetical protein